MAATDSIDVVLLHENEISADKLQRYHTAAMRVMIVSVDSSEPYRLAIDADESIQKLDLAEANVLMDSVKGLAVCQRNLNVIKVWRFGGPFLRVQNMEVNAQFCGFGIEDRPSACRYRRRCPGRCG